MKTELQISSSTVERFETKSRISRTIGFAIGYLEALRAELHPGHFAPFHLQIRAWAGAAEGREIALTTVWRVREWQTGVEFRDRPAASSKGNCTGLSPLFRRCLDLKMQNVKFL